LQLTALHQIPTHILHYEDYNTNFNGTVKSLLDFLELGPTFKEADGKSSQPDLLEPVEFISGKTYGHYFPDTVMRAAKHVVQALATPECWTLLRRYFV
jgi:hypothetical protein